MVLNNIEGMYIVTVYIPGETKRKGLNITTNDIVEVYEEVKRLYPNGYIEGFTVSH